jgi:type III restriction enzyme
MNAEGIKVLSLFFIDKVANYREYTENSYTKGKFAQWFEEAYEKIKAKPRYAGVMDGLKAVDVHNGYFAADKNGQWKDSKDTKGEGGKTKNDDNAYSLIMKDKERLLDVNEPLRFIFSHSALREGWDNPNVFNICTLNETSSEMKKRQEIGRGLRLPVNAEGERVRDESINILTVVANESYADFSRKLQNEIEDETGINFAGRVKNREDRKRVKLTKSLALDPSFKELWSRIKHKTKYSINIDSDELVRSAVRLVDEVYISRPQLSDVRTKIEKMGDGEFKSRETPGMSRAAHSESERTPDVLTAIQNRTLMTRRIIFDVLDASDMFAKLPVNAQQVIDEVSTAINRAKNNLAVDGIKYERLGEEYDMQLFENRELETYLYDTAMKSGAVAAEKLDKTVYDHVDVDSEVEYNFMKSLESADNVKFYVKLPNWFKIDTPLGEYNPDWAVAFEEDEKIYFVAETKGSDDINDEHLSATERGKILSARRHFSELGVPYAAPVKSWRSAVERLNR